MNKHQCLFGIGNGLPHSQTRAKEKQTIFVEYDLLCALQLDPYWIFQPALIWFWLLY